MNKRQILSFTLGFAAILAMAAPGMADDGGWVSLLRGDTLEGWTQRNGTATYRVKDGVIVGKTMEGSPALQRVTAEQRNPAVVVRRCGSRHSKTCRDTEGE